MELGRWSLNQIFRISERYRDLREFLADVLDGERGLIGRDPTHAPEPNFQRQEDVERLRYALAVQRIAPRERTTEVFRQLAPFFDAGFMLETGPGDLSFLKSMFIYGRVFSSKADEKPEVRMPLPQIPAGHVFRGSVGPVLKTFRLESLVELMGADVFALNPVPGVIYLFVCNRPHPWQVTMLERTQQTLDDLLGQGARA